MSDAVPENQNTTLFPESSVPTFMPATGYQIMLRNVGQPGAFESNEICVLGIGFTDKARNLTGKTSRRLNMLESCLTGEDISIWDNILFAEGDTNSGGGNMSAHGNVHILGTGIPPGNVSFITKADVYNCYECGGQGSLTNTNLNIFLNATERSRATLGAKLRVKNGLVDLTNGNAWVAPPGSALMDAAFVCESCGNSGYFGASKTKVRAVDYGDYDIPGNLTGMIHLPKVTDAYTDKTTNITYPTYAAYLTGDDSTGNPGARALRLAEALGSESNTTFTNSTTLAGNIWGVKNTIFNINAKKSVKAATRDLDPVDEADPLWNPTIGSGPIDGKTFMIVASDLTEGVVLVYKELGPFQHNSKDYGRIVHGFVFAPASANMNNVKLKVDIDGLNVDGDLVDWIWDTNTTTCAVGIDPGCNPTLTIAESNQLIRKVVNALWRGSQNMCGLSDSCYNTSDRNTFDPTMNPTAMIDNPGNLNTAGTGTILMAFGAIQTTDDVSLNDLTYNGRVTLFADDSNGGGIAGNVTLGGDVISVPAYPFSGTWYAFPCQINLGILARNNIEQDKPSHARRVGSFYAGELTHVTKQLAILGAMMSKSWSFDSGGNPDFHQAMEMSRCLPPFMIGDDVIPVLHSDKFVER